MVTTRNVVLTTREAAERLHVHPQTLRVWLRRGLFPHAHQIPHRAEWRIPAHDVDEFVERGGFDAQRKLLQGKIHHRGHPSHRRSALPEGRRGV